MFDKEQLDFTAHMSEEDPKKLAEGRLGRRQGGKAWRSVPDLSHQCKTNPNSSGWGGVADETSGCQDCMKT